MRLPPAIICCSQVQVCRSAVFFSKPHLQLSGGQVHMPIKGSILVLSVPSFIQQHVLLCNCVRCRSDVGTAQVWCCLAGRYMQRLRQPQVVVRDSANISAYGEGHLPLRLCFVTPRYCDERSLEGFESLASLADALDVRCFLAGGELSSDAALLAGPLPCACNNSTHLQYYGTYLYHAHVLPRCTADIVHTAQRRSYICK